MSTLAHQRMRARTLLGGERRARKTSLVGPLYNARNLCLALDEEELHLLPRPPCCPCAPSKIELLPVIRNAAALRAVLVALVESLPLMIPAVAWREVPLGFFLDSADSDLPPSGRDRLLTKAGVGVEPVLDWNNFEPDRFCEVSAGLLVDGANKAAASSACPDDPQLEDIAHDALVPLVALVLHRSGTAIGLVLPKALAPLGGSHPSHAGSSCPLPSAGEIDRGNEALASATGSAPAADPPPMSHLAVRGSIVVFLYFHEGLPSGPPRNGSRSVSAKLLCPPPSR